MQILNAGTRSGYTVAQITQLLNAQDLDVTPGLWLLDPVSEQQVLDISEYMDSPVYTRDCNATINGTFTCELSMPLTWGSDKVQPYVTLSSPSVPGVVVTFNIGIFIVTSPGAEQIGDYDAIDGSNADAYQVTGYDKLYLLDQPVGDTVIAGVGGAVLLNVVNILNAAGITAKINIDQTASAALLAADIVWALSSDSPATYLDIANDLLATVGYTNLWVDQDGNYTAAPFVDPSQRSPEYTINVQDPTSNIMADPRSRTMDMFSVPNWWRFVQNGLTIAPTEGNGQFTYVNVNNGLASYSVRGYYVKKVYYVDATSQQNLQTLAAQQIASDSYVAEQWTYKISILPCMLQFDLLAVLDTDVDGGVTTRNVVVQNFTMPLDYSDEMTVVANTALVLTQ